MSSQMTAAPVIPVPAESSTVHCSPVAVQSWPAAKYETVPASALKGIVVEPPDATVPVSVSPGCSLVIGDALGGVLDATVPVAALSGCSRCGSLRVATKTIVATNAAPVAPSPIL